VTSLAFAGAGWVTAIHGLAADAVPEMSVVHVASRRGLSAARRGEQTGAVVCRYDELPGGADAVVVATPPALHLREAERAVDGGAAALVETPLAATLADADALVELAGRGHVAYAENLVHSPVVGEAVAACRRIGALSFLEVRLAQGLPDWGEERTEPSWGGGALFDLGVHAVALALLMAAPARVTAVDSATIRGGEGVTVDDDATVVLGFDTGLRAEVNASWRAPTPVWDAQGASATGAVRLELVPEPSVEVNGAALRLPPPPPEAASPQLERLGYIGQLEALAADLEAGAAPRSTALLGRLVLEVLCAAYATAHTGERTPLPYAGPRDRTPYELWRGE
jgi:UDP-N-acetyl-2-amino-2-deoxyglucuronate dehydrogenase